MASTNDRAGPNVLNPPIGAEADANSGKGTKRKRGNEPKFYSVRIGHKPGIYDSWNDCLTQVKGFKGAIFKSFPSRADAESFMKGKDPTPDQKSAKAAPAKFYAVRHGLVPGIYVDWPTAQKQVIGVSKPKYRSFHSRAEAEEFLKDPHSSSDDAKHAEGSPNPPALKPHTGPPGTGPLPGDAVDTFDPSILMNPVTGTLEYKTDAQRTATRNLANGLKKDGILHIYTDGSSLNNGNQGAVAGVGVYFGSGDERNVSEPLSGTRQTNQRAELTALLRALGIAPIHRDVSIHTDSRYSIDCVTNWCVNWKRNNWKTSTGKAVENRDLIENILGRVDERDKLSVKTQFIWLKGHADDPGNVAADRLAVKGAQSARITESS